MLNWTCDECNALNTPRRSSCWKCGNGRSSSNQSQNVTRGEGWLYLFPAFRVLGVIGATAIIASLFFPWVIHQTPQGIIEVNAGYITIYGRITGVIGLILLFFMVKPNLKKGWHVVGILLAIITYYLSWMPVQISQVFNAIAAGLGGSEAETAVSIAGIGVSIVNIAAVLVVVAAIVQLFRPTAAEALPKRLTLQQS